MNPKQPQSGNHRPGGLACWSTGLRILLVGAALVIVAPPECRGQAEDGNEYRVKLAFLYNFAQFIQWPAESFSNAGAPLVMCVAGQDPFKGELAAELNGRTAGGHPIELRKLKPGDDPKSCHILFIRASEKRAGARMLSAVQGSNTLTVGETTGFAEEGGLINLTPDETKLRFEVNLRAAGQTHLKISSKLLGLAKIVGPK